MQTYELEKTDDDFIKEIPKHWNLNRAKKIFREIDDRSEDGSEVLLSVSAYTGVTPMKRKYEGADWIGRAESLEGYKKCNKEDLVINIMQSWNRGLGVTNYEGIVSPAYCVYRINHKAHPKYMHYLLRDLLYVTEFKRHSKGIIDSRLRLYPDKFLPIPIITPPIEEQEVIAKYLEELCSKINQIIILKEKQIKIIENYFISLTKELTTNEDRENKTKYSSKIDWIGEISPDWKIVRVKDCCDQILGGGTPKTSVEEYWGGDIVWLSPTDFSKFKNKKISDSIHKITNLGLQKSSAKLLPKNTVIMSSRASIGDVRISGEKLCTNQGFISFVCRDNKLNPNYFYYLIKGYLGKYYNIISFGATFDEINKKDAKNVKIPLPPFTEQRKISGKLDSIKKSIDSSLNKILLQIDALRQYKESTIHECVTGKKCVLEVKNGK
jgi:type I restriction enzyme, S subunit